MNAEELRNIISCGETSAVQFKECFSSSKKISEEIIAFANCKGGTIIFGVVDKTGEIKGLDYSAIQQTSQELANIANEQIKPTVFIETEVVTIDNNALLLVKVKEGYNKPYKDSSGNIWLKQGPDKRRITENSEILRLFHQSQNYSPDEEAVNGTSANDLDTKALDDFFKKTYNKKKEDFGIPLDQLLNNLRITSYNEALTLAGLLYFGSEPQQFKPAFIIKAV